MNIAFFTDSYNPTANGVVVAINMFASTLRKHGHRVYIFGPKHPRMKKEEDFFGISSFPLPAAPDFRASLPFSLQVLKQIPRLDVDIVHCHAPGPIGFLGLTYAKMKKVPVVATYHTMLSDYARYYIPIIFFPIHKFVHFWDRFFNNRFAAITTPTSRIKEYLLQMGIKRPITVISNGIDIEAIRLSSTTPRSRFDLPKGKRIIGCFSRMAREKNLDFIVETFATLHELNPATHLFMIGGGPYLEVLKKRCTRLGITPYVTFTGLVTRPEGLAQLRRADLFFYSCKTDVQPFVIMEALALGKPLVLLNEKVFECFVDHEANGYLVDEDPILCAKKINHIISHEQLLRSMAEHSAYLAQSFSIEEQTLKLIKLYKKIITT
jgi:1,2-diacylglycerol 3-alpha-glucosyltransferase